MRIDGYWLVEASGAVVPVLAADIEDAGGRLAEIVILVDTGAERTVLDYRTLINLGHESAPTGDYLQGIGGSAPAVSVDVPIRLRRANGTHTLIHGSYLASTDPGGMGRPILGRDVLDNFALIIDRSQDVVTLLHGPNCYRILES